MSNPMVLSRIAESDALTLELRLKTFYKRALVLNNNISQKEAVELMNEKELSPFRSLLSARTIVEERISKITGQKDSFLFKQLKTVQVPRFVWLFDEDVSFQYDLEKEGNECIILVMVKKKQEHVVYYGTAILKDTITKNNQLFGRETDGYSSKGTSHEDMEDDDNLTKRNNAQSPSTPKTSKQPPHTLDTACFEEMGLTIPGDSIVLNELRKTSTGFGTFKNACVFYKADERPTNNFLVMNKMKTVKSEYLCEIYVHSEFKSSSDWCLTVMEGLFSLKDVSYNVPSEMTAMVSLQLFHDILMGLKTLHQNKIIHCDVSFGNVMYYWDKSKRMFRAKIIDFNNAFNIEHPRKEQIIKLKDPYTPEDGAFTEYHDLYASALTFCRIVCELVEKKKIRESEDEFVNECIQTLHNCEDHCIISVIPLVQQILKGELKSVQEALDLLEEIQL